MTQVIQLIIDAYRETNLIALGDVPSGDQTNEALRLFNRIAASVLGFEVGEHLRQYRLSEDRCSFDPVRPPINSRVLANTTAYNSVLVPLGSSGARFSVVDAGRGFAAHPFSIVLNGAPLGSDVADFTISTNGYDKSWLYREDITKWVVIQGIEETDEFPYPVDCEDFFSIMLAMRLNPRYGRSASADTAAFVQRGVAQLRARYRQKESVRVDEGLLRLGRTGRRGLR